MIFIIISPGSAFIKPDQRNPWIKDQLGNALLSTISHLQLPNFVSCGRDKPLPHDTKFGNCRCEIVGTIVIFIWSLIHGLYWSGLIKVEPEATCPVNGCHNPYCRLVEKVTDDRKLKWPTLPPSNQFSPTKWPTCQYQCPEYTGS